MKVSDSAGSGSGSDWGGSDWGGSDSRLLNRTLRSFLAALNSLVLRRFLEQKYSRKTEGITSGFSVGFEGPNPLITGWM